MATNINKMLDDRENEVYTCGTFEDRSRLAQRLKDVYRSNGTWFNHDDDMKEALDMIFHKLARIGIGGSHDPDVWLDIAGYATLVGNRLESPAPSDKNCD